MASASLYRQCDATASSGYSSTWTWSGWVKRAGIGSPEQGIFMNKKDSDNTASRFRMSFGSNHRLLWECKDSTNNDDSSFQTNMEFKDTSAWYHIVFSYDSTQGTEANRLKLWVNGVDIRNDGGGFASIDEASNGFGTLWSSASKHYVGRTGNNSGTAHYFDGCMAHVHLTYGTTYTASTFGETDSTTGIWKPKTGPSVTYGSQGYFLKMDNSANMGLDSSGQSNNLTTSGNVIQIKDTPSNVFACLNRLQRYDDYNLTLLNNRFTNTSASAHRAVHSTLSAFSGKYYAEVKVIELGGTYPQIGVINPDVITFTDYLGGSNKGYGYLSNGNKQINGSATSYGNTYTTGDIIGIAMDLDNHKLYFSKNGTFQNSGVPTSGSTGTGAIDLATGVFYSFGQSAYDSGTDPVYDWNFGNGYFGTTAVASAGTNASGNGVFEFDVPAGYTALSTKGLNT